MVDGIGTTTYGYHPVGAPGATQTATADGPLADDTISYAYDSLGRILQRSINGAAHSTTYVYDALGRVTTETNALGTFTYGYDGVTSRLATVLYPNGQSTAYTYFSSPQDRRVSTILHKYPDGATLSKFDYTYDAGGKILTWHKQADGAAPVVWEYGYDPADQLTRAVQRTTGATPVILKRFGWGYDLAGNRLYEQIDDTVTGWTYDNLNRLVTRYGGGTLQFGGTVNEPATVTIQGQPATVASSGAFVVGVPVTTGLNVVAIQATDAAGNSSAANYQVTISPNASMYSYDAAGNLTSDGERSYGWDARGQLVLVTSALGVVAQYSYDGEGRRAAATIGRVTRLFLNDSEDVVEERLAGGGSVAKHIHGFGFDNPLATVATDGDITYMMRDHLDSITDTTSNAGQRERRTEFDPWGRSSTTQEGYAFTSRDWESSTGLYFMRARYYSPMLGRFISEDPLGVLRVKHLYAYAENSPVVYNDQTGLQSFPATNSQCSGRNSDAAFVICCYPNGGIGVCKGPAPSPKDSYVLGCMIEHENKHIWDLENDVFPCDKQKCRFAVQLNCAIAPGQKKNTECSGYCAEMACLRNQPPTADVQKRREAVRQEVSRNCRGKGRHGCLGG